MKGPWQGEPTWRRRWPLSHRPAARPMTFARFARRPHTASAVRSWTPSRGPDSQTHQGAEPQPRGPQ
eukprot:353125-Chlamydomonas_euryale.AAC.9